MSKHLNYGQVERVAKRHGLKVDAFPTSGHECAGSSMVIHVVGRGWAEALPDKIEHEWELVEWMKQVIASRRLGCPLVAVPWESSNGAYEQLVLPGIEL